MSPLEQERLKYKPSLPKCFDVLDDKTHAQLRVGVVLSGGQAAGGHNVISGLFDALKRMNPKCRLFGFLNGPSGIIKNHYIELKEEAIAKYRNTGGFDLIGSGREKIESEEQLKEALNNVQALDLSGLVIVGGDDSNTNAAMLATYFANNHSHTYVVGLPKTIDGDLKNEHIEISFGFDTACKTYSEIIGNIARDALSAKKYYHFIKLMGRSASHVTLECALQTHPNIAIIGEEVAKKGMTLNDVADSIIGVIEKRKELDKNYGVILISEGLIEFVSGIEDFDFGQLDPHGNIEVSHIATEQILIDLVKQKIKDLKAVSHFLGYEGRSCFPSNFDANYCYSLGFAAAMLIDSGKNGYMGLMHHLTRPVSEWEIGSIALETMMGVEERKGVMKSVIKKSLVDLAGVPFTTFAAQRESWSAEDDYRYPGPIQFLGETAHELTLTLQLEAERNEQMHAYAPRI